MAKLFTLLFISLMSINAQFPGKIIPPEEAFSVNFKQNKNFLFANIEIKDGVYLLDDKLIFEVTKPNKIIFTDKIQKSFPDIYKEENVHYKKFEAIIDLNQLRLKGSNATIKMTYQGCANGGIVCYPPLDKSFVINIDKSWASNLSEHENIANYFTNKNIFFILVAFFGFGLLLSLTPCTFPMIPILSSIITNHSKKEQISARKGFWLSFIYILFMSFAYAIVGIIAGLFGANIQTALQNPWTISIFSFIFIFLALSMFGFYNLSFPASFQNKISLIGGGKKSGILGIAIMGFLSALIIGPCVAAPLAGALIYIGESGDAVLGGFALFTMSLGMGIPLLIVGTFAGKFLPKPGSWMNIIQKLFGVILLFMAIWMLSRILSKDIIYILIVLVLLGCLVFINSFLPEILLKKKNNVFKIFLFLLILASTLYFSYNLAASLFTKNNIIKNNKSLYFVPIKNIDELNNLVQNSTKPILLDFFATWCISCIEFEEKVFNNNNVQDVLKKFTLAKIDVTKNSDEDKQLLQKFKLFGPPAIVFFKDKKELKNLQIVGVKTKEEFLIHLQKVLDE